MGDFVWKPRKGVPQGLKSMCESQDSPSFRFVFGENRGVGQVLVFSRVVPPDAKWQAVRVFLSSQLRF
jgi:hypothetical protein